MQSAISHSYLLSVYLLSCNISSFVLNWNQAVHFVSLIWTVSVYFILYSFSELSFAKIFTKYVAFIPHINEYVLLRAEIFNFNGVQVIMEHVSCVIFNTSRLSIIPSVFSSRRYINLCYIFSSTIYIHLWLVKCERSVWSIFYFHLFLFQTLASYICAVYFWALCFVLFIFGIPCAA